MKYAESLKAKLTEGYKQTVIDRAVRAKKNEFKSMLITLEGKIDRIEGELELMKEDENLDPDKLLTKQRQLLMAQKDIELFKVLNDELF